jgi:lipopolysaccharide transport system ATP-binding protein
MSRPIINTENLGKRYKLSHLQQKVLRHGTSFTLREAVAQTISTGLQRLRKKAPEINHHNGEFWALRNVSLEVERGEVIGLIGRNGAGKSTLLKILSRIVDPTEGTARLRGRVASLLEVGTGFHSELTGRENIYLNGAMLGMRKGEIDRKFDEIVAFSEVENFLDTPVKRYSSGMYVRLAFAVAAHLEPEILIVDEVLAVGDHAFQKKCLGKMRDVATGHGRTVLFVSHNMGVLAQLCQHGVLLDEGQIKAIGPVKDVIQTYLKSNLDHNAAQAYFPTDLTKPCQYVSAEVLHGNGRPGPDFICDEPVVIRLRFEIREFVTSLFLSFQIQTLDGTRVLFSDMRDTDETSPERLDIGLHTFEIQIPARLLAPGTYLLSVRSDIRFTCVIDQQEACCEFTLSDLSLRKVAPGRTGVLGILLPWNHHPAGSSPSMLGPTPPAT